MGVCNAAESLVVHADVAQEFLPRIGAALAVQGIEIRGDERTRQFMPIGDARRAKTISRPSILARSFR